ncbi:unnamed protein product, partial [Closterium sp. NIES-54]
LASPLPAPSPYAGPTGGLAERREPESRPASPVRTARTSRRVPRPRPPAVLGTHQMALRPSTGPQSVPLLSPLESSLPALADPASDSLRTASPTVMRFLATVVTNPSFESTAASALVAELVDFAGHCRLDYAASLVAESASVCPPSVGGECALSTDVLEDREEEFQCFAAALPHLVSTLLAPKGDPDAPDILTRRSYAEAIEGPYSFQWQAAMDAEIASWKSTGTYVDEVPPPGANIVSGMWIFRVMRPPGSPPVFKAHYVARGFSQRQGVDYFQTFPPTSKMTTLRVLLHVVAQRDYELHSLDFSTAFLQGSLHEEIWLRCPLGFTGSFPPGTQWSLRRPVYGLRQAPREWHDTLRTTLTALGFAPSTADPSLFLCTDTLLSPFYILVYVDDLVFATADTAGLTHVKSELQKRHTCTDLGELRSYLGLQITRDRARRTITLTQSHMVQQVLQHFDFTYSSPQATTLSTHHSLSALPSDESVEPSGPYPELVGCLMYLMTCTRPDLAYPLSILARYVAPRRHRPEHMAAAKRVLRYLCSTSGLGLVLGGRSPVVLTGHADASWVDDLATQRSSQGYTFSLGSGSVSWRSTRSSSVLSSSCEAEIYAGAMAAQELRWLTYLLTDLGEPPRSPPVLYVDNKAMLALCREHRLEHRTKHIALCYFLARELQQRGQLRLAYVASQANTADIFTKALQPCDHQRFCTMLAQTPQPAQMPLLYTIVSRGTTVLAEFSVAAGNANAVARRILEKLPVDGDARVSYTHDRHVFHILRADGLVFLCMADAPFGRRVPFAYLEDVHMRFMKTYGRVAATALAYAMNDEFSRVLAAQMEFFSSNPNSDTISRVKNEISEVKSVMVENIDMVLDRGNRIELLVDKTATLQDNTFRFKKQARTLKRALWWKNTKLISFLGQNVVAPRVESASRTVMTLGKKKAAAAKKAAPASAIDVELAKWYGPDRRTYLPEGLLDKSEIPSYLTGEVPGDYGYDPLGLSKKPADFEKYRANEVIHGRWAMLGAAGFILPEAFNKYVPGVCGPEAVWFKTGALLLEGDSIQYLGATIPVNLAIATLAEVVLVGGAEFYRGKNASPLGTDLDTLYPGGSFDPLGLASDPDTLAVLKVKELKNGRLAMFSMLGFFIQAKVTGEGPVENLTTHLSDPFGNNLLTSLGSAADRVPTL